MKKGINFKMKMDHWRTSYYVIEDCLDACIVANEEYHNIPVPSEDIWKKFELLPTPPRSPTRDEDPDDPTETLMKVTNLLDTESVDSFQLGFGLKNDLLHDCMWSGLCTELCKKNAPDRTEVSSATAADACVPPSNGEKCVDPSSVLPYTPLSDHSYHQATRLLGRETVCSESVRTAPSVVKQEPQQRFGSDTPSDSDDEDDEIDVVSYSPKPVIKRKRQCQYLSLRVKSQCRAAKKPAACAAAVEKRKVREDKLAKADKICRYSSSSRSSSDSEDCEKRSQHNSMERKRRDDLRYAFQTLRENVPELKDKPKAPKIVILNQAATYVHQLTSTGQNLERTLKQETKRRHQLQRRLMQLQRTKF